MNTGGINGKDGFKDISTQFKAVLADMVQLGPSNIRIQELCDDILGCTQVAGRKLLQAGDVLVRFVMETTNEMELVEDLLDPSFSFLFAARLATETGIKTITANVELASTVSLGQISAQSDPGTLPSVTLPNSTESAGGFSIYAIAIGASVFVCCNLFWFRKTIRRCLICKAKRRASGGSDKDDLAEESDDQILRPDPGIEGRAQRYLQHHSGPIDNASHSEDSRDSEDLPPSSAQPPAHEPLSLVVRPPSSIMTGPKTSAHAPDETLLPPSVVIAPPYTAVKDLPTGEALLPPRAPAILACQDVQDSRSTPPGSQSGVRTRSPMVEMHASPSSGQSVSTSDGENVVENVDVVVLEDRGEGEDQADAGLLDETGFFKLNETVCADDGRSCLGTLDLTPLFDMVSLVDGSDRYVDGKGLREMLAALRPSSVSGTADALYLALGVEPNSRLSLEQLQLGWSALGERSAVESAARESSLRDAAAESFVLERSNADGDGSTGSWDSD